MGKNLTARFGAFTLDGDGRRLSRDAEEIHVTPKAFDLLLLLVDQAPRVIPKTELHERLWPGTFVSDATLVGLIKELRRALDDYNADEPIIRTVNRVGYGFARPVEAPVARRHTSWHWLVGRDTRFPLSEGENLIGRDPESSVWLDVASVSRSHARIAVDNTGATLEDLKSKNGTKVGSAVVASPTALKDGDRITVGTVLLTYRTSTSGFSTETQLSGLHGEAKPTPSPKVQRGKGQKPEAI